MKVIDTSEIKVSPILTTTNITLEEIRAKLAAISQAGKQNEIKALITKFGANKLTEIKAEYYTEILKEAEVM